MKLLIFICLLIGISSSVLRSEEDSSRRAEEIIPAQEAVYSRPFIYEEKLFSASVGGYCEANSNYFSTDGVSEGMSLEFRRFNIFLFSSLAPGLKFISELEFEHGSEEIKIETAQLDLELYKELVLRGGIILVPLGSFNLNHDSPKWDIIDRPLVSTMIIPSTFSEVGFGIHGRTFLSRSSTVAYSGYISNGLTGDVILNSEGRTFLPLGKSEEIFAEDNNGSPAYSAQVAAVLEFGEIGLSHYRGYYNDFKLEGEEVAEPRLLTISAIDISMKIANFTINGEAAYNSIDVPENISEIFGTRQWGAYLDISYPLYTFNLLRFNSVVLNGIVRFEFVDFNVGDFESTGLNIYDEIAGLTAGLSLRLSSKSIVKLNYLYREERDAIGNPAAKTGGIQAGFATYF